MGTFLEQPRFPEAISFHALGGPGWNTTLVEMETGNESRDQAWSQAKRKYEVSHAARTKTLYDALLAMFHIANGRTNAFRFKDWSDFIVTTAQGRFLKLTSTTYQLIKRYIAVTGYTATSTTSLAIATGSKTFTTQSGLPYVAGDRVRATYTFDPSQFMEGAVTSYSGTTLVVNVDTIGTTGTIASWDINLAGSVHDRKIRKPCKSPTLTITSGTGSLDYTTGIFTLSSGGLTTWAGQFDVPCRFDIDEMKGEIIDKSGGSFVMGWQSVPIVEVRA